MTVDGRIFSTSSFSQVQGTELRNWGELLVEKNIVRLDNVRPRFSVDNAPNIRLGNAKMLTQRRLGFTLLVPLSNFAHVGFGQAGKRMLFALKMKRNMSISSYDTQITQFIIALIAINVMYVLFREQLSPQVSFHDQTMFGVQFAVWASLVFILRAKQRSRMTSTRNAQLFHGSHDGMRRTAQLCRNLIRRESLVSFLKPCVILQLRQLQVSGVLHPNPIFLEGSYDRTFITSQLTSNGSGAQFQRDIGGTKPVRIMQFGRSYHKTITSSDLTRGNL